MVGLACAGGVVEGALYEVGALRALDEALVGRDLHTLDVYVGVSSGALIGSLLANGVSTRTLVAAVAERAPAPLNLRPEVLFAPALGEYAGRLGRLPQALASTALRALRRPGDLSLVGLAADLTSLVPAGFFDNSPLERYLARAFTTGGRANDFRRLDTILRVVTMHLDSAEVAVFGDPGRDAVPVSKAIQASTALPGLYCPVEIDGAAYIDGVARRTVHASVALDAGATLVFCVNPIVPVNVQVEKQMGRLRTGGLSAYGLPSVLSQTFRALVDSRKTTGFKKYAHTHPDADLVLIEPAQEETNLFFSNIFSFSNREAVCQHAYATTRAFLRREAAALGPVLARHGLALDPKALAGPPRRLFDEVEGLRAPVARTDVFQQVDHVLARLARALARMEGRQAMA